MFAINSNHPVTVPCNHDADWMMREFTESDITTGEDSQEITSSLFGSTGRRGNATQNQYSRKGTVWKETEEWNMEVKCYGKF